MKTKSFKTGWIWGICALLLSGPAIVRAQDDGEAPAIAPAIEEPSVAESPAEEPGTEEPAATPAPAPEEPVVEPVVAEPPAAVEPVAAPAKPRPDMRGADLSDAFQGAGSSLFGVKGRTLKLPAKKSVKKEKGVWRREIELGTSAAQGNKDNLRYDASAEATRETEVNFMALKVGGRYGESDDERDAENATGEAKFQHLLTERWYVATEANIYHDQIADLAYRARGSLSLGRFFVRAEKAILSVEAGPGYVAERKGGVNDGFMAGRVAQHLEFLVTSSLQVWQAVEYIPSFEDSRVYFVNAEVGLETLLVSTLSLVCTVENRYDSNPAEGKESNDLLTKTALKWKF